MSTDFDYFPPAHRNLARILVALGIACAVIAAFLWTNPAGSHAQTSPSELTTIRDPLLEGAAPEAPSLDTGFLGELVGRAYRVRIFATPDGPRYTVCDASGAILQADMPADEIYRTFPDLDLGSMWSESGENTGGLIRPLMLADPDRGP